MTPGEAGNSVERSCPLCGHTEASLFMTKGELRLVRCSSCTMVYATPVPKGLISGEFYDQLGESFYLMPDKLAGDYSPVRFLRELKLFRRHCSRGDVLDVGCSTGGFLHHLLAGTGLPSPPQPSPYRVTGMDVSGPALDHAEKQGIPVIRGHFLEHDFGSATFDAVTFWAVMEHLGDPARFLDQAAALLRPGGICVILVPNLDSLAVRLLGSRYRYIMPDHVNCFAPATLRAFTQKSGLFEEVEFRSLHFNPVVLWQDWRKQSDRVPDTERARLLSQTNALKSTPLLRPLHGLYRMTEFLLSRLHWADNIAIVLQRGQT